MAIPCPAHRGPATAIALSVLAACDIPTEPPRWGTEWEIPVDSMRLTVEELLPATIQVAPDRRSFVLLVDDVVLSRTLGEICGAPCTRFDGESVPKPAFTLTLTDSIALPQDVAAAALTEGAVTVALTHDFSFDPLRPPGAASTGSIAATLRHAGAVLGTAAISGATTPFPAGETLALAIPLQPTALSGPIVLEITLASPASEEPVRIDASERITVVATPTGLRVREAEVTVQQAAVTVEPTSLDLRGVDDFVVDNASGGALVVEIANPLAVEGTLRLLIDTPTGPITKEVAVQPGGTEQRLPLTREELRRILGNAVVLSATGTVTSAGATVTVTPRQALVVRSRLELILGPEEG